MWERWQQPFVLLRRDRQMDRQTVRAGIQEPLHLDSSFTSLSTSGVTSGRQVT